MERAELDRILLAPGPVDVIAPPLIGGQPLHEAQVELWNASAKVIAFVAGSQSGKTCIAPYLTLREIRRKFKNGHANEHLVASPTYPLMSKKLLPEYRRVIEVDMKLGEFMAGGPCIRLSDDGIFRITGERPLPGTTVTIWFGHAQNAEALESATYMSAVLDEAGQDSFRPGAYQAVLRRVTINQGAVYILTTPYNRNWFYELVFKRARVIEFTEREEGVFEKITRQPSDVASGDILVVTCPSIMNPSFPRSEWEFNRSQLPAWQFDMMFGGKFTLPAGVIFDSFTDANLIPRQPVPKHWPVYAGVDFGLTNTAVVLIAEEMKNGEPTGTYWLFDAYHEGVARESRYHVKELVKRCPWARPIAYGGSHAESGWREAWAAAGLPIYEPTINGVWVQINTLWVALDQKKLLVFDDLQEVVDELRTMSREIDDDDMPIPDKIKDEKKFHRIAGMRYVATRLFRGIYRRLSRGVPKHTDDNLPFPREVGAETSDSGGLPEGGGGGSNGRCSFFQGESPLIRE